MRLLYVAILAVLAVVEPFPFTLVNTDHDDSESLSLNSDPEEFNDPNTLGTVSVMATASVLRLPVPMTAESSFIISQIQPRSLPNTKYRLATTLQIAVAQRVQFVSFHFYKAFGGQ